jgi:hypothetical protein
MFNAQCSIFNEQCSLNIEITKPTPMNVLVFKTNLHSPEKVTDVSPILTHLKDIKRWNVDVQDCDHVLRIESETVSAHRIEQLLSAAGYYCEELAD